MYFLLVRVQIFWLDDPHKYQHRYKSPQSEQYVALDCLCHQIVEIWEVGSLPTFSTISSISVWLGVGERWFEVFSNLSLIVSSMVSLIWSTKTRPSEETYKSFVDGSSLVGWSPTDVSSLWSPYVLSPLVLIDSILSVFLMSLVIWASCPWMCFTSSSTTLIKCVNWSSTIVAPVTITEALFSILWWAWVRARGRTYRVVFFTHKIVRTFRHTSRDDIHVLGIHLWWFHNSPYNLDLKGYHHNNLSLKRRDETNN